MEAKKMKEFSGASLKLDWRIVLQSERMGKKIGVVNHVNDVNIVFFFHVLIIFDSPVYMLKQVKQFTRDIGYE